MDHLKATMARNIEDNISYPNLEFVLLNYNSSDDIDRWVLDNLSQYLDSAILKYYKTTASEHFKRSHSRNMAFKLASGDILCNVDADNFLGSEFAFFINETFQSNENIFMVPVFTKRDFMGRVCIRKEDFESMNGFDESMQGYGFEDLELYGRLKAEGFVQFEYDDPSYLNFISHSHIDRFNNDYIGKNLDSILISYIHPNETKAVYLFKDSNYEEVHLLDDESVDSDGLIEFKSAPTFGKWVVDGKGIHLENKKEGKRILGFCEHVAVFHCDQDRQIYYMVDDQALNHSLILIKTEVENRKKYERHKKGEKLDIQINPQGFGLGDANRIHSRKIY